MKRILMIMACMVSMAVSAQLVQSHRFCIAKDGNSANIIVDQKDWTSVIRAARDLSDDIRKVSGTTATILNDKGKIINDVVIISE